ncbi:hydantoinase/oxoprolinase N-terminal domain-containing protein, partial [Mesorhizobium sp. M1C.F.Ca.ET.195.01.1.1]|uniref:hydantoinase/oxoprolinase N-terminal domain-containing protein n=1 Tax=Mesorhizobium sp. M1C.F.Ca.ET.195.01.1.1 TaxID=2563927 RepID=UPI0032AEE359
MVPRDLCFTVRGRLAPGGTEIEPLNEADVHEVAAAIKAANVEAVGVLFLHSYANPTHEERVRKILEES